VAKPAKTGWTLVIIGLVVLALMGQLDWLPVVVPVSMLRAYGISRMSESTG
jgi:hypothetical protein